MKEQQETNQDEGDSPLENQDRIRLWIKPEQI